MSHLTIGFIGLGLIGGSIAKALRQAYSDCHIVAYDINTAPLIQARTEGIINELATADFTAFSACNYLFLCAPVSHNDENLRLIQNIISPSCILTDVGSVKATTHQVITELGLERQFIGGHPMTGSERIGFSNSKALFLENAYYILTPTTQTSPEQLAACKQLVAAMGAIPLVMDDSHHDYITGAVSHLPHIIAACLVNLIQASDDEEERMKMIAAGGFKDITRIASSSPEMWQQICLTNTDNILQLLKSYISSLLDIKKDLEARDATRLYELFDHARTYRDSFANTSSGPIKKAYSLTVDIADRTGALAAVVALLARHDISIKNIGITHNREHAEGALRIEFHQESDILCARSLLLEENYMIHEKK